MNKILSKGLHYCVVVTFSCYYGSTECLTTYPNSTYMTCYSIWTHCSDELFQTDRK